MKTLNTSSYPYTSANRLKLLRAGNEFYAKLYELIEQSAQSIYFQIYIYEDDETGQQVTEALIRAANRGVKIFLLVDGYASQGLSREIIKNLIGSGVNFNRFEPIFKSKSYYFGRRMHHKVMVFDSYKALVGGINISNNYSDEYENPAWLDWAVYVEGKVVEQLEDVCKRKVKKTGGRIFNIKPDKIKIDLSSVCKAKPSINDWINRKMEITQSYLEMFSKAKSHVYLMSPYFLPGGELLKAIIAAANRGVQINLILTGVSDIKIAKHAERYMYRQIFKHNIHIYEYQPKVLHGKLATYDGKWTTVGSYNVNNISAYASVELNLDVDNVPFALDVEQRLKRIIAIDCTRLDESDYLKKMNYFKLFIQRSAYDIFRLILFLFTFYFKQKE